MKWEERWTYDAKTFKPKAVKVRNRRKLYWNDKVAWAGAGGKTYFEGESVFASEGAAHNAGISAAKAAVDYAAKSSERCWGEIAKANKQIEDNAVEAARITKILAKLEATP